jgi:hypothetical protein
MEKQMNSKNKLINQIRRISSILLLIFTVLQALVIFMLAADIFECEVEEFHGAVGYIFMSLMLVHILVYWKGVKALFISKKFNP